MPGPRAASRSAGREPPATSASTAARATPAAVPRHPAWAAATTRRRGIDEQHGQAVRGLDAQDAARAGRRRAASPSGRPSQGARARRAVDLLQQVQAARRRERRGHARAAASRVSQPAGAQPLLEAVDEAGDGVERGHGRGAQRARPSVHRKPGVGVDASTRLGAWPTTCVARGTAVVATSPRWRRCARGAPSLHGGGARLRARKSDPERRLAARLAAKRAAVRLLGGGVEPRRRRGRARRRRAAAPRLSARARGAAARRWAPTARW